MKQMPIGQELETMLLEQGGNLLTRHNVESIAQKAAHEGVKLLLALPTDLQRQVMDGWKSLADAVNEQAARACEIKHGPALRIAAELKEFVGTLR